MLSTALMLVLTAQAVEPYVDPGQLDCPWPEHSHYKQPFRAYMETRRAWDYLSGVGVAYNLPEGDVNHDLIIRHLWEHGIARVRIEIPGGAMAWDGGLQERKAAQYGAILDACRRRGVRPLVLLNSHQGVPCPTRSRTVIVAEAAEKGARRLRLKDVEGLIPGRSGLSNMTKYWAAEALFAKVDEETGWCELSKPLPRALRAGEKAPAATLKWLPLYPVGTEEFDETARNWAEYAVSVCDFVRQHYGSDDFDVELWNELTFGSQWLDVNNYYDPPLLSGKQPDFLREGGRCWELARRTIAAVKRRFPQVRCIWGFSNTTFFHTPVAKLPPLVDGQSYHPYNWVRQFPDDEQHADRLEDNLEGYVPSYRVCLPEGIASTFLQTECILRLINPEARRAAPRNVDRFYHYITEHGFNPSEVGVTDVAQADDLKARFAVRTSIFWVGKGIEGYYMYCAWQRDRLSFGLLPADAPRAETEADLDTPAMQALARVGDAMEGAEPLGGTTALDASVWCLSDPMEVFAGDGEHPPLPLRDCFVVQPFQVTARRFVIAMYDQSRDFTRPTPQRYYRVVLTGLPGRARIAGYLDPITGEQGTYDAHPGDGQLDVTVAVVDYPRLLVVEGR